MENNSAVVKIAFFIPFLPGNNGKSILCQNAIYETLPVKQGKWQVLIPILPYQKKQTTLKQLVRKYLAASLKEKFRECGKGGSLEVAVVAKLQLGSIVIHQ
jgi:hypothetical protein